MKLIPKCVAQSIEDVSPGSLIYHPASKFWAIRAVENGLFRLNDRLIRKPDGVLLDFGSDYTVSVEPDECFSISSISTIGISQHGSLCLFPTSDGDVHSVLIGNDDFADSLHLFELETGKKKMDVKTNGEGVAFKSWKIWLPMLDERKQYRTIFEYPSNPQ